MKNYSLNQKSTQKASVVHATKDGNILCSNKVADPARGFFTDKHVTCKRCLSKINAANKPAVEKKPKVAKAKKISANAELKGLVAEKTQLAIEVINTPKEQRKQPEFIAKRARLVELRDKLQAMGYEATTFQANAKVLAGMTFVTKKRGRKKKVA